MKLTKTGICIAALFCVFTFQLNVHALPGDLDTTFDTDGKTTTPVGVDDYPRAVAIQPDGKIVVVGYTSDGTTPTNYDVALVRYNADGSLDTSFGTGGKVLLPESGKQFAYGVAIRTDGKILAVGTHESQLNVGHLAVYRFNADGSPDMTFGTGGRVVHVIGDGSVGYDVVLQPDGKIVIGGYTLFPNEATRFTVFRLNTDGSLDTSFNSIGYTPVLWGGTAAYGVALQSDGKIVAGGRDTPPWDSFGYWGRFGSDGILEGGVSNLTRTDVQINDVGIQTDGKLVFAGFIRIIGTGQTNFGITRYNPDRTLDIHFGNYGVNIVNWGAATSTHHRAFSLVIQPSGRMVVGGHARIQNGDFGLVRFNAHGFLDQGFGNGGRVNTHFGSAEEITALAQQPDGKIVAVGTYNNGPNNNDYAVARYDAGDSNTLPNRAQFDFDGDGRADVSVFRPSTGTWYIFNSSDASVTVRTFGIDNDVPVPADYDADARTDFAIRRPSGGSWWYLLSNGSGFAQQFPAAPGGDYARPGDFTGDGRADIIAYDSSNGGWSRRDFTNNQPSNVNFGAPGDKPVLGDFDGDTKVDPAIYRPSTCEWWYAASSASGAHRAARWGISTDIPAAADFDGDHKTDFAVYRPSEGVWYIFNSSDGSFYILNFGLSEDKPVPADYDGDGKADIAVFRPSTGVWYVMRSTAGFMAMQFGVSTDIPTPNAFVP